MVDKNHEKQLQEEKDKQRRYRRQQAQKSALSKKEPAGSALHSNSTVRKQPFHQATVSTTHNVAPKSSLGEDFGLSEDKTGNSVKNRLHQYDEKNSQPETGKSDQRRSSPSKRSGFSKKNWESNPSALQNNALVERLHENEGNHRKDRSNPDKNKVVKSSQNNRQNDGQTDPLKERLHENEKNYQKASSTINKNGEATKPQNNHQKASKDNPLREHLHEHEKQYQKTTSGQNQTNRSKQTDTAQQKSQDGDRLRNRLHENDTGNTRDSQFKQGSDQTQKAQGAQQAFDDLGEEQEDNFASHSSQPNGIREHWDNYWSKRSDIRGRLHEYDQLPPREARLQAKQNYRQAKHDYREQHRHYSQKLGGTWEADRQLRDERHERKVAKKQYKYAKKTDPATVKNRVTGSLKTGVKQGLQQKTLGKVKQELRQDDYGETALNTYDQYQQGKFYGRTGQSLAKNTGKITGNTIKGGYHLANRSKNLVVGKGFVKTPYDKQLWGARKGAKAVRRKAQRKMRRNAQRLLGRHKAVGRGSQYLFKFLRIGAKGVKTTLSPVGLGIAAIVLLLIIVIAAASSTNPGIKQTNNDINKTWLDLTKIDAEKSDQTHHYFTNWSPYMFYLNERFGDFNPRDTNNGQGISQLRSKFSSNEQITTYPQMLQQLWTETNQDDKPLTVQQLMDGKNVKKGSERENQWNSWAMVPEKQEDVKTAMEDLGFDPLDNQLDPLQDSDEVNIIERFGYEKRNDKVVRHDSNVIAASPNTMVKAPLSGKVQVLNANTVKISVDQTAALTIAGIDTSHVLNGQDVVSGQALGNAQGDFLDIRYDLYDRLEKEWFPTNIGFYVKKANYLQFTTVVSDDFDPSKNREGRAQDAYNYLTKKGYKKAGIVAMLGNFDVESGINPKRAEGDYLNPPVGKSDSSWDDDNWLNMGGPAIYNGRFPNIIHRGLGLGQWTDVAPGPGGRNTMLREFAKSKNKKWYDLGVQLDFLLEVDSKAAVARNILNSDSQDVQALTIQFLNQWEGNPGDKVQARAQSAFNWFSHLKNEDDKQKEKDDALWDKYKDASN
ncbi:phage tail tip lysozyme [Leuconostocaceae bacterium ESL0958]|nr:phage tail tip lysozyme [Leuconostocaceae bacterium ESL0958]